MPDASARHAAANLAALRQAVTSLEPSPYALWLDFFALGGNASLATFRSWLDGWSDPTPREYAVLSTAVNEALSAQGGTLRVAFDLHDPPPPQ